MTEHILSHFITLEIESCLLTFNYVVRMYAKFYATHVEICVCIAYTSMIYVYRIALRHALCEGPYCFIACIALEQQVSD